ncbi:YrbL family protein [Coralliovum pocilloporae]|uniref:YrbL family protein n=1 Tax=Coralliovum pocilloporae TaxID=3066369 RepID=UPI003306D6E2
MLNHSEPLRLSSHKPLSHGSESTVYYYPENPDWLVKVMVPSRQNAGKDKAKKWYKRFRRDQTHRYALRQVNEYLSYQYRGKSHLRIFADFVGFVETDLGFGLVVQRVQNFNGETSETLEEVVRREGITPDILEIIDTYCAILSEHQIVMVDIRARNLMVVVAENGQRRLVAIDSFGERNLIPMATNIKWWNTRHIQRHRQQLMDELARLAL